jgi:adenosylcobinamide kinase / adenosylcobinamide-phosphate guanylyltransferase
VKTLVLGGVRSGKSRLAAVLAAESGLPVTYVATAEARDDEMRRRIAAHRAVRPAEWRVIEEPLALCRVISRETEGRRCIVVDCLTLWLTNLLSSRTIAFEHERGAFLEGVRKWTCDLVLVSNETNMGIVPLGDLTRRFCDEAGLLHQELGRHCDRVMLCVAGIAYPLKGERR